MFSGRLTRQAISLPLLTTIGGMCYTIYLYHPLLKSALKHLTFRLHLGDDFRVNIVLQIVLLGTMIVMICAALFLVVEKPFMYREWPSAFWRWLRRDGGSGPAAATRAPSPVATPGDAGASSPGPGGPTR